MTYFSRSMAGYSFHIPLLWACRWLDHWILLSSQLQNVTAHWLVPNSMLLQFQDFGCWSVLVIFWRKRIQLQLQQVKPKFWSTDRLWKNLGSGIGFAYCDNMWPNYTICCWVIMQLCAHWKLKPLPNHTTYMLCDFKISLGMFYVKCCVTCLSFGCNVYRLFWMLVPGLASCHSLPSKLEPSGCMPLRHQAWPNTARWSTNVHQVGSINSK